MKTFSDAITFIGHNLSFLLDKTWQQLELSGAAIGVSLLIAIPIGLAIFGLGFVNVLVALVVLAVPPLLTNAYVAIDGVDREVVEAARGMGMSPLQILLRVELPLGLPLLFAGIRTAAVYVVATATIASIAGGEGLGDIIFNQASYRLPGVVAAAIWVSALALAVEGAFALLQRLVTPAGLRRRAPGIGPATTQVDIG